MQKVLLMMALVLGLGLLASAQSQYPNSQYPNTPTTQQYPNGQYPNGQQQYPNGQPYPNPQQYPNGQNPNNGQYPNGQPYPNGQGQQLPGGQVSSRTDNVNLTSGPVVQNLTPTTATLAWQTDDRAATDVRYGLSPNQMDQRAFERGGDRNHTAELKNLQPGRTYYWAMLRNDGSVRTSGQFNTPR